MIENVITNKYEKSQSDGAIHKVRTLGRGGGGHAKSVQVRTRGDPNFADFERTYFMDGPDIEFLRYNNNILQVVA